MVGRVMLAEELSDEIIDAIEVSEMPPDHRYLDAELEGSQAFVTPNSGQGTGNEQ